MKTRKTLICILLVVLLAVCVIPFTKKIDNAFPTIDQEGKETVVTVKGTYYNYLILNDKFKGVLVDEKGFEYPSVKNEALSSETTINDKIALPITFAYVDASNSSFVTAYFDVSLDKIHYCMFME